jgi:hypothetical protein
MTMGWNYFAKTVVFQFITSIHNLVADTILIVPPESPFKTFPGATKPNMWAVRERQPFPTDSQLLLGDGNIQRILERVVYPREHSFPYCLRVKGNLRWRDSRSVRPICFAKGLVNIVFHKQ